MMEKLIPVNLGDHVVIRPGEELDSLMVHGKIESKTWNNFTQDYQYGIVVPGQQGEAHDVVIVTTSRSGGAGPVHHPLGTLPTQSADMAAGVYVQ